MTTALFAAGLTATVAGIALLSIPAAAIALGAVLMAVAVLIERDRTANSDAVADAARAHQTDREYPHAA